MAGKPNPPKQYATEPIGRPSKFTPERRAAIIDDIAHRIPYEMAAEANGITVSTLYDWLNTGKEHNSSGIISDYTIFSEGIKHAEKQRVREHCENIASKPERWQADAWLLERRWYKYFGPNAQLNELNERMSKLEEEGKNEERNEERSERNDEKK